MAHSLLMRTTLSRLPACNCHESQTYRLSSGHPGNKYWLSSSHVDLVLGGTLSRRSMQSPPSVTVTQGNRTDVFSPGGGRELSCKLYLQSCDFDATQLLHYFSSLSRIFPALSTHVMAVPFAEPPWLNGLPSYWLTPELLKFQKACKAFITENLTQHAW